MDVIASNVRGEQTPIVAIAAINDPFKYCLASRLVHLIRRLVHQAQFERHEPGIRFSKRCSETIVISVHGTFRSLHACGSRSRRRL